jgi:hypothetical protein
MSPQPDCCQRSTLRLLRTVDESRSGQIVLELCEACRTYWLVSVLGRFEEECVEGLEVEDIERISDREGSELLLACAK